MYPCLLFGFFAWLAPIPKYTRSGFICMTLLLSFEVFGSKLITDDPQDFAFPLRVLSHELGYLGPDFLNCPKVMSQIPSSVYNFLLELPMAWTNLIRNLSWKCELLFSYPDYHWFGTLGPQLLWIAKNISFSSCIFYVMNSPNMKISTVWRFQKIKLHLCIHLQLYICIK